MSRTPCWSIRARVLGVLLLVAVGCGGATTSPVRDALEVRLAASPARLGAPDLHARARGALDAAHAADTPAAREAARVLAGVWLDAAEAETSRIDIERQTAPMLEQLDAVDGARIADEEARWELAAELLRRDAARIAWQQAVQAFEQAKLDEQGRRRGAEVDALRRRAATALLTRARLVLAAAIALRAPAALRKAAGSAIDGVTAAKGAAASALSGARTALDAALAALGAARAARPGPSPEELASLIAAATDRGLSVQKTARGLRIDLGAAFRGRDVRPSAAARAALSQIRSLLLAHPHGQVMVEAHAVSGKGGGRLAIRRAKLVASSFELSRRVQAAPDAVKLSKDGHLAIVLTAYGE